MVISRANISGEEHDTDNRETALKTTKGPYIVAKFPELQSIMELLKQAVYSFHPPSEIIICLAAATIMLACPKAYQHFYCLSCAIHNDVH